MLKYKNKKKLFGNNTDNRDRWKSLTAFGCLEEPHYLQKLKLILYSWEALSTKILHKVIEAV